MAITEHDRHRMYQRLEEVLGSEEAATLMEHLPPVGWADVATKRDLDHLRVDIEQVRTGIDHMANKLRAEWRRDMNRLTIAVFTSNIALAGVVIAAVTL